MGSKQGRYKNDCQIQQTIRGFMIVGVTVLCRGAGLRAASVEALSPKSCIRGFQLVL